MAILLIIVLLGIYSGSVKQMSAYVDNVDADLWIAQSGSPDMLHSFSVLSAGMIDPIGRLDGVQQVYPLTSRTTLVDIDGQKNSLILVGYEPGAAGGPWSMVEGRSDPGPGEIVCDRVTMKTNNLQLGDSIEIDDKVYEIVGVSDETTIMVAQYAFVDIGEARRTLGEGLVNFILVKTAPGADGEQVRREIADSFTDVSVFTKQEFSENNAAVIRVGILPILAVVVVIAFIIGVAIVGLVVYSATLEKYREYGVLKAVGASDGALYRIVLEQAVISSLLGFVVGALASLWMARIISRVVVQIDVAFSWEQFASAFGAAIVMSVIASYVPARKINNIDPVIVFKG